MTRRVLRTLFLMAAWLVAGYPAHAQPTSERSEPGKQERVPRPIYADNSHKIFQSLFHYRGVKPVPIDDAIDYKNTIVVVCQIPTDRAAALEIRRHTTQALRNGGAVFIAHSGNADISDYFPNGSGGDLAFHGVAANTKPWTAIREPLNTHSIASSWFGSLENVRLPQPGFLYVKHWPEQLSQVCAWININVIQNMARNEVAVAGAGTGKNQYRCAILADASCLTNYWLLSSAARGPEKSDNFPFAYQTVLWLQGPEKRTRCLLYINGERQTTFDHVDWAAAAQTPPLPPLPPLLPKDGLLNRNLQKSIAEAVDGTIAQLEDNHVLDEALTGKPGNDRRFVGLLVAVSILLLNLGVWLVLHRVWKARHRSDQLPPPSDPLFLGEGVAAGSFEHRRLELIRGGNLLGPVREYLRLLFLERGLTAIGDASPTPRFRIDSRNPQELRESLLQLWRVAFDSSFHTLSYSRWKQLEPVIEMARSTADAGLWHVATDRSRA